MNYETLEEEITRWARVEHNVQALVLIGSRAREDHTTDVWSDLDLILSIRLQSGEGFAFCWTKKGMAYW